MASVLRIALSGDGGPDRDHLGLLAWCRGERTSSNKAVPVHVVKMVTFWMPFLKELFYLVTRFSRRLEGEHEGENSVKNGNKATAGCSPFPPSLLRKPPCHGRGRVPRVEENGRVALSDSSHVWTSRCPPGFPVQTSPRKGASCLRVAWTKLRDRVGRLLRCWRQCLRPGPSLSFLNVLHAPKSEFVLNCYLCFLLCTFG